VNNSSRYIVVLFAMLTAASEASTCWGSEELLEQVRAGNQATLESIRTLYCRVTRSAPVTEWGAEPAATMEYWWSAGSVRLRSQLPGQLSDSVFHEQTARSLLKGRDPQGRERSHYGITRVEAGQTLGPSDPWRHGLLKLCGPAGWPLTLDELLRTRHKLSHIKRETVNGCELIVVGLSIDFSTGAVGNFEIAFDPQLNYLARRLTGTFSGAPAGADRRESEVLQFREVAPAMYFPEHSETRFYKGDQVVSHEIVQFSDVRINAQLPPDIFKLPIPPGATVHDSIEGNSYTADADGNAVGPKRPLPNLAPLQAGAMQTETLEEHKSRMRWILPGALAVLLLGCSLWFVRAWRSERN
jgi:hypothetical protein